MEWTTIERPGYFGKKRNEIERAWDAQYGAGNWRIAYAWRDQVVPRAFAIQLYEDGYYEHLRARPQTLDWLVRTASDVYDTAPSNVQAGLSYDVQETPNNHIHDVAIRRAVLRLGAWFAGDHLVEVRAKDTEGKILSPGIVPFHLPALILQGDVGDYGGKGFWWEQGSIEDFYQRNKLLQVRS